jgi:hypothetical protein
MTKTPSTFYWWIERWIGIKFFWCASVSRASLGIAPTITVTQAIP